MTNKIQCETHGECDKAYVCSHLVTESAGLGFNRSEPSDDDPFPDAWCDDCELIRATHNGWNEKTQNLCEIRLLCSRCYNRTLIRNMNTNVTLNDLETLRWKCGNCEEWHTGPCLDFTYNAPHYWQGQEVSSRDVVLGGSGQEHPGTFLNEDYCAIESQDFFVRGIIHLPIIGTAETFRWGVWGSLSRENFEALLKMDDDPRRAELPPMFSWLSNQIAEYPDTLNLKMYAHIKEVGYRPNFELEPTDHPLAQEFHNGITAERVKAIMMSRLPGE